MKLFQKSDNDILKLVDWTLNSLLILNFSKKKVTYITVIFFNKYGIDVCNRFFPQ